MGVSKKNWEKKVKACTKKGIDRMTCGSLINLLEKIDDNQTELWQLSDNIEKVSKKDYEKLDKAYNNIGSAKDWLNDIIGDFD